MNDMWCRGDRNTFKGLWRPEPYVLLQWKRKWVHTAKGGDIVHKGRRDIPGRCEIEARGWDSRGGEES